MRLKVDKENDALYFRLDESAVVESEEIRPGVVLDFDKDGKVVGIEFLKINSRLSDQELSSLQFLDRLPDTISKSKYQKALERNLFEASKAILERKILVGFEKAGKYSGSTFLHVTYEALFNDMIAHAIKIFGVSKDEASFWHIKNYKQNEIDNFIQDKDIDITKLEEITCSLKHIRDKTHFHIDRKAVINPEKVWSEAGIIGKDLAKAIDDVWVILNHLFKLEYGRNFPSPDYDSQEATSIANYAEELSSEPKE